MDDTTAASPLQPSPLADRHAALGAKLAAFGGWEMPLEYATGVVAEHTAVRERVGLFDVSHLGTVQVTGPGAAAYVNATLSNDLRRISPGQAQYTLCCDPATGGVVDDLIVYLHSDERLLLMPNAANAAEVVRRLVAEAPDGVRVDDEHTDHAVLAVQGPASAAVLDALGLPTGHDYMSFLEAPVPGGSADLVVCRTGYTGEHGYELVAPAASAGALWDALVEAGEPHGLTPAGLGARDTLRTEMGYPLHGQDLSLDTTPVQARMRWAVGWDKPSFWGDTVLRAEREAGAARSLRGLRATGRGIPRPGMTVTFQGEPVGELTSGTFSPTLRTGVGLAYLATGRGIEDGAVVEVDVRGRPQPFEVVRPPFLDTSVRS
ncbi:glycine cleavage system aminomethyltransferase GcvT [Nocardioides sp. CFH 31398]|uniref:glycine cleavage system aminomethyltransferase GcvT n=1 Tax=Nocardioides sp. CFH 31398 TaxID=2919579 RepID=UPI001F0599D4|nr:glycine cleavage system aminomethyltransferase GcvT [Nocardioides sp. CFH 31398]MCH1867476.1 glycine cleavage system aminomethyltransferase GcvT [Nocardioides sp. CFH 31398]